VTRETLVTIHLLDDGDDLVNGELLDGAAEFLLLWGEGQ
jgi:hypothetical protein